tara:strand:+ start:9962 stop:11485 length:1524 start_codon:yes stop_codon:yes gene_type:complete
MSDIFNLENYSDVNATNGVTSGSRHGTGLDTGDLRRKFNFGDRVSELNIAQDPFFRFVSKVAKKSTDDPSFKFTEKRPSWHKRYAYVAAHGASAPAAVTDEATVASGLLDAGDTYYFGFMGDYLSAGNRGNVFGQATGKVQVGAAGTQPTFLIPGQLIKVPYGSSSATFSGGKISSIDGYVVAKVESVDSTSVSEMVVCRTTIVKGESAAIELAAYHGASDAINAQDIHAMNIHDEIEPKRSYVVGSAFAEGSGYPETWKDQPYTTGQGQTQIWKTTCAMTNTARATVLKYEANEWARVWKEKLVEHKFDIEQSLLFGSQYSSGGVNYTQGAIDWVSTYGNSFSLAIGTKTADDFLDDLSNLLDPRYNNSKATVFFCSTEVYNWLHKLGGYFQNNLEISTNFRADLAVTGRKKVLGLDTTTISTVYGDMNVVRNIHLDGTNVSMLGVNMKHCAYRPLAGNGLNRDTSVYVGVQTLENSGVDRRVDMILTEAGMQWEMPESHAVWIKA